MPDPSQSRHQPKDFDLYSALDERGIQRWVRPRGARHEEAVTALLAQLGDERTHPSVRHLVLDALAPARHHAAAIDRLYRQGQVLADRPYPTKSPDLVSFASGGSLLQAVEVKFGKRLEPPRLPRASELALHRHDRPVLQSFGQLRPAPGEGGSDMRLRVRVAYLEAIRPSPCRNQPDRLLPMLEAVGRHDGAGQFHRCRGPGPRAVDRAGSR